MLHQQEIDWWLYSVGKIQPEIWCVFVEFTPLLNVVICWRLIGNGSPVMTANWRWTLQNIGPSMKDPVALSCPTKSSPVISKNRIPAFAVHGRYDVICPVKSLLDLADVTHVYYKEFVESQQPDQPLYTHTPNSPWNVGSAISSDLAYTMARVGLVMGLYRLWRGRYLGLTCRWINRLDTVVRPAQEVGKGINSKMLVERRVKAHSRRATPINFDNTRTFENNSYPPGSSALNATL